MNISSTQDNGVLFLVQQSEAGSPRAESADFDAADALIGMRNSYAWKWCTTLHGTTAVLVLPVQ
jgi:hypothetical protein